MRSFAASSITALSRATRTVPQTQCVFGKRTFASLPTLRPTLGRPAGAVFRSSTPTVSLAPTSITSSTSEVADIVPRSAISASPIFGFTQIRCGPRATLARSSRLIRKRRHGFLSRVQTRTGRRTLQRRRTKNRHILSN